MLLIISLVGESRFWIRSVYFHFLYWKSHVVLTGDY